MSLCERCVVQMIPGMKARVQALVESRRKWREAKPKSYGESPYRPQRADKPRQSLPGFAFFVFDSNLMDSGYGRRLLRPSKTLAPMLLLRQGGVNSLMAKSVLT